MVLLPPIIFEAAFTLQRMTFFKNILVILSLAFIGGVYSAIFVSGLMWLFTRFLPYKLTMVESLVYGSLISSTDPVTILAMLPSSVDKKLYMLIFGESALNDAVAIILYRFFTELADPTVPLGFSALLTSALSSIAVFVGSFAVGVVVALAFALLTKYVKMPDGSVYELAMLMIFAYMSYLMAELFHLTGIVSIFFCGSAMSHYAYNNLSE
ncbi:MAG: Cation/H+ exchanger, partial [Olpidium bornovanus]